MQTDITHTSTGLLKKDKLYILTNKHHSAFIELIRCIQIPPILTYLDPNKPYFLFTDGSKYYWSATLS